MPYSGYIGSGSKARPRFMVWANRWAEQFFCCFTTQVWSVPRALHTGAYAVVRRNLRALCCSGSGGTNMKARFPENQAAPRSVNI